ncbi:hypothetical protein YC2023_059366 [Brassica napus]
MCVFELDPNFLARSEASLTNGRSQLRSSSFAEEARFLLDVVGSNPISALSKGFILHHSPRRSRPRKVFEAAEAGSDNTAFLRHILDDLSENGAQSSALKEAMNQIGLVAQSPLDQFEILPAESALKPSKLFFEAKTIGSERNVI